MELQQLLKSCKKGSITAQKCLYDQLCNGFFLLCRRYLKTSEDAEEMMLNGFLKIFAGLASFYYTNDAAAMGWMKRIMVNECLMHLRKRNSFLLTLESSDEEPAGGETILEKLNADEIFKLITKLPVGYRTVFNLFVIEGLRHTEISALLDISEGTSKSQLNKAKNMLKQLLMQNNYNYGGQKAN
jgi:RNA polymerase sigma factor (sigma-70 family)